MSTSRPAPRLLWHPRADAWQSTQIGQFARRAAQQHGVASDDYAALWQWSVDTPDAFWQLIVEHFDVTFHSDPATVRTGGQMPGVSWFPGATLNYAEHALRQSDDDRIAIVARSQSRNDEHWTYGRLRDAVGRAAAGLRRLGVEPGDRVAAYLPNIPEAIVAFLATASLGATWSSCAPEFGVTSVIDRFAQIEPAVLIVVDGYRYGGKDVDRRSEVEQIAGALPSLRHTIVLGYLDEDASLPGTTPWADVVSEASDLTFAAVAFDHPLYILFSSGTTGIPKAIVHGHGGITLEHLKMLALHHDLSANDRFFWFTTTGWMMWNYLVSGLLVGSTVVLFDGDPGHPDLQTLWRLAADVGITTFGVSAPYLMACRRAALTPGRDHDLSRLRQVGSTGAPLAPEGFAWVYDHVGTDLLLASVSGGTDVCTAFVGAAPVVPVWSGEISCRCLGAKIEALDSDGRSVIEQRGELVITEPMPSMPVGFWGDPSGERYRDAYFDTYVGVWRHGDWIRVTERGSCVITGRSDATLNRGGVRMGTSEFYRVVEDIEAVRNALVIHLEDDGGGPGALLLFVVLDVDVQLDDRLRSAISNHIRTALSPRHVPEQIHSVPDVPRTLSGKKLEVPVKKLFAGAPLDAVVSEGALANPESLVAFRRLAKSGPSA